MIWRVVSAGMVILSLAGCGQSDAEKSKYAILRVLTQDKEFAVQLDNMSADSTASQIAEQVGVYCSRLEQMDFVGCPAEFTVAYRQHMRAWRDFQSAVAQLPEGVGDALLKGILNALGGEPDGGRSRLEGDVKQARERVRVTWEEVERIGAKYGAAI